MFVGIDVGGTNLKAGLVDQEGHLLAAARRPLSGFTGAEDFATDLTELVLQAAKEGGVGVEALESVGIGLPGAVDGGNVLFTTNIPMENVPLAKLFRQRLDVPVYLGNDADCAAVGEFFGGAGRGCRDFVVVTLGTGIGAGIILDGKLRGGLASSEAGHMVIQQGGEPCNCGRRGCWEQYASASALKRFTAQAQLGNPDSILARVIREHDGHVSGQSAFMAARLGDPVGQQVCDMYVGYLAAGIANVVNIFQPDTLAIGGGVSNESDEQLLHPLQQLVERETIPCSAGKKTRIVKAQLGNQAGIIGAALLGKKKRI